MSFLQVIYASQPFGYDLAVLNGILSDARRCNERDDVTGALICRADIYLQLLEGPAAAVEATFNRIMDDDRHANIVCLSKADVEDRIFPDWAMLDDPARSWIWTQEEIKAGAIKQAKEEDVRGMFVRLASELD